MARQARFVVPSAAHLLIQRGRSDAALFVDAADAQRYLSALTQALQSNEIKLHAFGLHACEVRLVVTPPTAQALSKAMQSVARRYAHVWQQRFDETKSPWTGRYGAAALDPQTAVLPAMRFAEFGTADSPPGLMASSEAAHRGQRREPLLNHHAAYWALGNTPFEREVAYQSLAEQHIRARDAHRMHTAAVGGWPIGGAAFLKDLELAHQRPAAPAPRGRPRHV